MNNLEYFNKYKLMLENIFSPDWFMDNTNEVHPAYKQYNVCCTFLNQSGILYFPYDNELLFDIARIALDSQIISNTFSPECTEYYSNNEVYKLINSRITIPNQFEDLMVELYTGAWHKTKNHIVQPMEIKGYPDIKVEIPGTTNLLYVECKHMYTASHARLRKVIKKANNQIKNAISDSNVTYGVVVIDVSKTVTDAQQEVGAVPKLIQDFVCIAQSALGGHKNKSVGAAILVWDDFIILGTPPKRTQVAFRRNHARIDNQYNTIPINIPLFEGYTAVYGVQWKARG
jgi:hypothetical protein